MTVRERVQDIFRDVFQDPSLVLRHDLTNKDVPAWDSLNHINLVLGIETEFGIRLKGEEVVELGSVGDIFTLLARHGIQDGEAL